MDFKPVKTGKQKRGDFIVVYGEQGVGKTRFAMSAPKPVFIDVTDRIEQYKGNEKFVPTTWEDYLDAVSQSSKSDYETIVLDEFNSAEVLAKKYVHKKHFSRYESFATTTTSGSQYSVLTEEALKLLPHLFAIRDAGKNLIINVHPKVKETNDPQTLTPFLRHQMGLENGFNDMLKRNCDALLFINVEVMNAKQGDKDIKRAVSTNEKFFFTDHHYSYDAKNLFGLPQKIKFKQEGGWALIQSLKGDPNDPKVKQKRIEAYFPQMNDKE